MRHALDLWSFEGRVTRREFLVAGAALFAVKYVLDAAVARAFGEPWNPLMYFSPAVSPLLRAGEFPAFWLALLAVALPFIAAGVSLCARRLRDMGFPPFWCGLFFLPFLHWLFFVVLTVAPSAPPAEAAGSAAGEARARDDADEPPLVPWLASLVPTSVPARFVVALLGSLALATLGLLMIKHAPSQSADVLGPLPRKEVLGTGLFFGLPFGMGFWSGFVVGYRRTGVLGAALLAGGASVLAGLLALLAVALEGVACIVMALPILTPIALLGAAVGYWSGRLPAPERAAGAAALAVAALVGHDLVRPPEAVLLVATTEVRIKAPPGVVWRNVTSNSPIDEPFEPIFAIVAAPLASVLEGEGVGARRRCVLTVGELEETVAAWEPGRELAFVVDRAPERFARYGSVERGRFLLLPQADGTTLVRGTTWYRLRVAPAAYWSLWTQRFVGAVHRRVLAHVKRASEDPLAARANAPARLPDWIRIANATCPCTRHAGAPP